MSVDGRVVAKAGVPSPAFGGVGGDGSLPAAGSLADDADAVLPTPGAAGSLLAAAGGEGGRGAPPAAFGGGVTPEARIGMAEAAGPLAPATGVVTLADRPGAAAASAIFAARN
jgi:hypothetical protein